MATSTNIHPEIKLRWCRSVLGCRAQEVWLVLTSVTGTRVALTWLPHLGWYEAPPTPLPCGQHTGFILIKDKVHEGGRSVERERDYWVEPFHVVPHKFAVELFLRSDEPSPFWSHLPQLRRRYLSCGPLPRPASPSPSPRPARKWRSSAALTYVPPHSQPGEEDVGLTRGGSHGQLQPASASLTSLRDPDQAWASAPTLSRAFRVAVQLSRAGSRILPGLSSASSGVCLAPEDLSGPTSPESPEPVTEDTSSAWSPRGPPLRLQDLYSESRAGTGGGRGCLGVDTSSYEDLLAALSAARRATFKTELNLLRFDSQTQDRLVREVLAASDSDFEDEEGECEAEAEEGHYGCVITFESRSTSMEDVGSPRALEAALVSLTSSDTGQDPARPTTPESRPPASPQARPLPQPWTVTPATDSREESVEVWGTGPESSWLEEPRRPTPTAEADRESGSSPDLAEDSNFQYDSLNQDHHRLHLDISHLDSEDSMEGPVQHRRLRQLHTRGRAETEHGDEGDESEGTSSGRGHGTYEVAGGEARFTSIEGEVATDVPLLLPLHPEKQPSGKDTTSSLPLTHLTSVTAPSLPLPHYTTVTTPSLPLPTHPTIVTTPSLPLFLDNTTITSTSLQPSPLDTKTVTSLPPTHPTATTTPLPPLLKPHHSDITTPQPTLPPPAPSTTIITPLPQPRHTTSLQPLPQPRHTPVTPLLPSPPATLVPEKQTSCERGTGEVAVEGSDGAKEGTDGMHEVSLSNTEREDRSETFESEDKNNINKEVIAAGGLPRETGGEGRSEERREKEGVVSEPDSEGLIEIVSDEATSEPYSNGLSKEPDSDQATKDSGSEAILNEPEESEGATTKDPNSEGVAVLGEDEDEIIEEIPRVKGTDEDDDTYVTIRYLIDIGPGGIGENGGGGRTRMLVGDDEENGTWEESEGVEEGEDTEVRSAGDEGDDEGNGFDDDDNNGLETREDSEDDDGASEVGGEGSDEKSDVERTRHGLNDESIQNGILDEGRTPIDDSERKTRIDEKSEDRTRKDGGECDKKKSQGIREIEKGGMKVREKKVQHGKEEGMEYKTNDDSRTGIRTRVKTEGGEEVRGAREKVRGARDRGGDRTETREGREVTEERGRPRHNPSTQPLQPSSSTTTTPVYTTTTHRHSPLISRTHSPHLINTTTTPSPSRHHHHHWTKFDVPYTPLPDRYSGPWSQKTTRGTNVANAADYPTKPTLAALQRTLYAKVKGESRPHQFNASYYSTGGVFSTNVANNHGQSNYNNNSTNYQGSPTLRNHHINHSLENLKYKHSSTGHLRHHSASAASQYDTNYTSHQYLRRHSFSQYQHQYHHTSPVHNSSSRHLYHTSPVHNSSSRHQYQTSPTHHHQHLKYPVLDSSLVRSSSSLALSTVGTSPINPPLPPAVSSSGGGPQGGSTGDLRRSQQHNHNLTLTSHNTNTNTHKYTSVRGASSLPNLHNTPATAHNPTKSISTTTPAPTNTTRAHSARDLSTMRGRRRRWGKWGDNEDSGGSTDSLIDEAEDAASTPLHPSLYHHPLPTTTTTISHRHHTSVSNLLQTSYESEVREKHSQSFITLPVAVVVSESEVREKRSIGRRHRRRTRSHHGEFPDTPRRAADTTTTTTTTQAHTHTLDGVMGGEGRPFLPYRGDQLGPGQQVKVLAPGGGVAVARVLASLPSPARHRREQPLDASTSLQESVTVVLLSEPNRLQGSVVTVPLDKVLLAWPRP
ncbi:hypothetical protein Pcinc_023049 [Petrolisthes cinctipes]|uniref:Uncharacterized protein n=1 Tax=Petrolisthes cinctipes TaxID=88211 RepID=A0AAE1FGG2_PETCI|nr:hypothetical protein Pcinc_023049 [Petrolisthes cinctipes]